MNRKRKPQPFKKGDLVHVSGVAFTKDAPYWSNHGINGVGEDGRWMPGTVIVREVLDVKDGYGRLIAGARPLVVFPADFDGIIVGWTTRRSGVVYPARKGSGWINGEIYDEGDPGHLANVKVHKVWMVEPIDSERFEPPKAVLPEYLERVE